MVDRLIVGLGNIGREYEDTWHNLGFYMLDAVAAQAGVSLSQIKFQAFFAHYKQDGRTVYLMKPTTYMNNSGVAVQEACAYFKLKPEQLLVIYDDFELPFGDLRYRDKGGAGTHNGMKSIVRALKSENFPRLRVGAGPIPDYMSIVDFVLSKIPPAKQQQLPELAERIKTFIAKADSGNAAKAVCDLHAHNLTTLKKLAQREAYSAKRELK